MLRNMIGIFLLSFLSFWATDNAVAQEAPAQDVNYIFSGKDAITALTQAIIKQGVAENIKVYINGIHDEDTMISALSPVDAEIDDLDLDKMHERWQATLILKSNNKNLAPIKLAGRYDEMTQIPVLKRSFQAGEIITMDDIGWQEESSTHLHKTTIMDPKDLVGKSPKRIISQDRPIRMDEVASPALINKGARITLIFKSPNLEIRTLGEALDSGAKGEVIRVKNITSKAIIQGTVETGDRVRITIPESTSAEAM